MDLRVRVDEMLLAEIEKQLERMDRAFAVVGGRWVGRGRGSTLKGTKVPPKYRWLVAAIKGGKKLDDFLIDKSARKGRRKRRSKR